MSRTARIVVIAGLVLAALTTALFTAWALYAHATWNADSRIGQSRFGHALRLLTQHELFVPGAILAIAAVVVAAVLVVFVLRGKRWPFLVIAIGSLVAIAPGWLMRAQAWRIERAMSRNASWAARSPYVTIATMLALALTIYFALLAFAAVVAWVTSRDRDA